MLLFTLVYPTLPTCSTQRCQDLAVGVVRCNRTYRFRGIFTRYPLLASKRRLLPYVARTDGQPPAERLPAPATTCLRAIPPPPAAPTAPTAATAYPYRHAPVFSPAFHCLYRHCG